MNFKTKKIISVLSAICLMCTMSSTVAFAAKEQFESKTGSGLTADDPKIADDYLSLRTLINYTDVQYIKLPEVTPDYITDDGKEFKTWVIGEVDTIPDENTALSGLTVDRPITLIVEGDYLIVDSNNNSQEQNYYIEHLFDITSDLVIKGSGTLGFTATEDPIGKEIESTFDDFAMFYLNDESSTLNINGVDIVCGMVNENHSTNRSIIQGLNYDYIGIFYSTMTSYIEDEKFYAISKYSPVALKSPGENAVVRFLDTTIEIVSDYLDSNPNNATALFIDDDAEIEGKITTYPTTKFIVPKTSNIGYGDNGNGDDFSPTKVTSGFDVAASRYGEDVGCTQFTGITTIDDLKPHAEAEYTISALDFDSVKIKIDPIRSSLYTAYLDDELLCQSSSPEFILDDIGPGELKIVSAGNYQNTKDSDGSFQTIYRQDYSDLDDVVIENNQVVGLTSGMEYLTSNSRGWTECDSGSLDIAEDEVIQVRIMAYGQYLSSLTKTLVNNGTEPTPEPSQLMYGDIDEDKLITSLDASLLARYLTSNVDGIITKQGMINSDTTHDSKITMEDLVKLKKYLVDNNTDLSK